MDFDFKAAIRTIPDYPKPGIMFRDFTTLLKDPVAYRAAIDAMVQPHIHEKIDKVAGIEARGFILGGAMAYQLNTGFIPIRKKGKLPAETLSQEYELEYGTDIIEIHKDAVKPGEKVLIADDLIATGGTAVAAIQLLERAGAEVVGCSFIIDLPDLHGADKIRELGKKVYTLTAFNGD